MGLCASVLARSTNAEGSVLQQEHGTSGNTEPLTAYWNSSLGEQSPSRYVKVLLNVSLYCFKVKGDSLGGYLKMDVWLSAVVDFSAKWRNISFKDTFPRKSVRAKVIMKAENDFSTQSEKGSQSITLDIYLSSEDELFEWLIKSQIHLITNSSFTLRQACFSTPVPLNRFSR